jgi:hypothetical protein
MQYLETQIHTGLGDNFNTGTSKITLRKINVLNMEVHRTVSTGRNYIIFQFFNGVINV